LGGLAKAAVSVLDDARGGGLERERQSVPFVGIVTWLKATVNGSAVDAS
jgi:hypothetical protein